MDQPAVKNHISPKMARELIAIYHTMNHSLSLVYRRVRPQRPHLLRHHLHHRIPYLTSADTPKIQYQKEVEVRVRSYGETRCIDQQKPKIHIKMKDTRKYRAMRYLFEDENNKGFLQEKCWYCRTKAENFGDLISADHKSS